MDIEELQKLTDLMVANDLTEIMVRDGESRVVIRRNVPGAAPVVVHAAPPHHVTTMPTHPAAAAPIADTPAADLQAPAIRSPMVGTFYESPKPSEPAFVSVGSRVEPDTVVCIIEAMKVFNEIKAEISGVIEELVVKNAQPVEFGQVLFRVTPR